MLCESDIGVTLQPDHIETRFSIRSRVVNYFWTRLPVLVSDGDITAEWVRQYQIGRIVAPGDVQAVAEALIELLDQPKEEWAQKFETMKEQFIWRNVVAPLRNYCLDAYYAPDRETRIPLQLQPAYVPPSRRSLIKYAIQIARDEGLFALLRRSARHVVWLITRS
jgi:hypothetical protein